MTSLIKSDIFFFITSISVVLVTLLVCFAVIQVIRILKKVDEVSETINKESKNVAEDVRNLRSAIAEKAGVAKAIVKLFRIKSPKIVKKNKTGV